MFLVCTWFKFNTWTCPVFLPSENKNFPHPCEEKVYCSKIKAFISITLDQKRFGLQGASLPLFFPTDPHGEAKGIAVPSLAQLLAILLSIPVLHFYVLLWHVEWFCRQAIYDKGSHSTFQIVTVPKIHFPDSWFSLQELITQYFPSMSYAH